MSQSPSAITFLWREYVTAVKKETVPFKLNRKFPHVKWAPPQFTWATSRAGSSAPMNLAKVKQTIKPWWFCCIHKLQFIIFFFCINCPFFLAFFFLINWKVRDRATGFFCCLLVLLLTARENRQIRYSLAKTLCSWHGYMKVLAWLVESMHCWKMNKNKSKPIKSMKSIRRMRNGNCSVDDMSKYSKWVTMISENTHRLTTTFHPWLGQMNSFLVKG